MKLKSTTLALIVTSLALATCLFSPTRTAKATDIPTRIYPSPQSPTINSTLNFTLSINVENVLAVTTYQVYIRYDPTLLNVTDAQKGTFLSNNSQYGTTFRKIIGNDLGLLRIGEWQGNPGYDTGISGNGTLFTVTFLAKRTGQCALNLTDTGLFIMQSELLHRVENGYFNNQQYTYQSNGNTHDIMIESNSTAHDLDFDLTGMSFYFNVSGPPGTTGYVNVTIPKGLLDVDPGQPPGAWIVLLDGAQALEFTTSTNGTHTFIHLIYGHSDRNIRITGNKVIPEFSVTSYLLVLMFAITAILLVLWRETSPHTQTIKQSH